MTDKREKFKQRLEQLQEIILSGLAFYAVWNKLRLRDEKEVPWSLDRQNLILGRWRGFFTPVAIALQRMAILEFAKVFDTNPRAASLVVLLNEAKRDESLIPHVEASDLAEISDRLGRARATLENIKKMRNQRLAHADAIPDPLPPLMNKEVERLAEDIKYAFNQLSLAHDRNTYSWDFALEASARDTASVLGLLLKEIERSEAEHNDRMVEIVKDHIRGMEAALGRLLKDEELNSVTREFALTEEQTRRVLRARVPEPS